MALVMVSDHMKNWWENISVIERNYILHCYSNGNIYNNKQLNKDIMFYRNENTIIDQKYNILQYNYHKLTQRYDELDSKFNKLNNIISLYRSEIINYDHSLNRFHKRNNISYRLECKLLNIDIDKVLCVYNKSVNRYERENIFVYYDNVDNFAIMTLLETMSKQIFDNVIRESCISKNKKKKLLIIKSNNDIVDNFTMITLLETISKQIFDNVIRESCISKNKKKKKKKLLIIKSNNDNDNELLDKAIQTANKERVMHVLNKTLKNLSISINEYGELDDIYTDSYYESVSHIALLSYIVIPILYEVSGVRFKLVNQDGEYIYIHYVGSIPSIHNTILNYYVLYINDDKYIYYQVENLILQVYAKKVILTQVERPEFILESKKTHTLFVVGKKLFFNVKKGIHYTNNMKFSLSPIDYLDANTSTKPFSIDLFCSNIVSECFERTNNKCRFFLHNIFKENLCKLIKHKTLNNGFGCNDYLCGITCKCI
jgi:hypothetical protein